MNKCHYCEKNATNKVTRLDDKKVSMCLCEQHYCQMRIGCYSDFWIDTKNFIAEKKKIM